MQSWIIIAMYWGESCVHVACLPQSSLILHLAVIIFWDCSWPSITETVESKPTDKEANYAACTVLILESKAHKHLVMWADTWVA